MNQDLDDDDDFEDDDDDDEQYDENPEFEVVFTSSGRRVVRRRKPPPPPELEDADVELITKEFEDILSCAPETLVAWGEAAEHKAALMLKGTQSRAVQDAAAIWLAMGRAAILCGWRAQAYIDALAARQHQRELEED